MNDRVTENRSNNRRTTLLLSGVVVLMFGFGFAMVPLYNLFCQVTGTQSLSQRSTIGQIRPSTDGVDENRWVTVKFDATVNPNLPWDFSAVTHTMRVHPGKTYEVNFLAQNRSHSTVTGQAIPSVAPWQATPYFSKLECFCFNKQTLTGTQKTEMPLRFMVSTDLPEEINSMTLSYSFMRLKEGEKQPADADLPPLIAANPDN
ncbi:MAG: cytochrome c oxidase assembly protein [Candidatus Thiodiazotropha sp. (ex Lucinoma annulata)]|nr:cytochrome c oxidase assembly protein [Candidatus Thiodiazotropha sp. (ex Lucinoma borealis)]MCU7865435.1 cytochrome c oxidase assembly protein [Candidatus Thiodiazotropha sp. (ex Lucinoma borealis)]MCU7867089.1 cytochrome c oxidase assembly protein [Candidatus Thiodiazotropha sp. (ex Lucinoma borealis)]MCU7874640.1 cytochrome c oxidase assembly protein [Candidatus Thiodiazotropha sp. (ex Lucinoma borealis)]MCU7883274.1 cytochrome c oxidase assembly protein [Candidatus Thiodiazotropha sp. (e